MVKMPVLCGCGWRSLAMDDEEDVPDECPVCGYLIGGDCDESDDNNDCDKDTP